MDTARKFVDRGQIDKAVKEYLRIVQEDPKDVRVWLKIGDLYAKKGAKQEATDTYLKVARFYHDQGFFLKAVAVYKQILKLDPRQVGVILKLAELYQQLGLVNDATQHYESVAAHYHREGNTKAALATVQKLVELDPENIATRIKLAELFSKAELVDDAATQFAYACDQLRRQDRQEDFLKVAERLLWHKPDNPQLNRELAGLYLRRNDPRRALQKLQACYKADKRDVETLGLLALAFQALGQKAKTVSVLKELARIHLENKARDAAADVYRKIVEIVPHDQDAQQFLSAQVRSMRTANIAVPRTVTAPPIPGRATSDVKFGITNDLPSFSGVLSTGSVPLVDAQSLTGNDFALPEYDDADFTADLESPLSSQQVSAASELHAEEILKIFAETDVYIKYGLHGKAADHLQRVFKLDPDNVEAHERLKDLYVSQNREPEAEAELLKLAELVASADPTRAETYLEELLALNGTNAHAFELARKFRLRVARLSSVPSDIHDGGGVVEIDADRSESFPVRAGGKTRSARDSIDDFDPNDLIGGIAHGSPAPSRPPQRPTPPEDGFDLEPPPFDRDAAREFDAGLTHPDRLSSVRAFHGQRTPSAVDHLGAVAAGGALAEARSGGGGGGVAVASSTPAAARHGMERQGSPLASTLAPDALVRTNNYNPQAVDQFGEATSTNAEAGPSPNVVHRLLEDDLEEAEFFIGQEMFSEAIDSMRALLHRYPNHPLILTKIADVESMQAESFEASASAVAPGPGYGVPAVVPEMQTDATDFLDDDDFEEISEAALEETSAKPAVMLEKPVDESDSDTHYDLGLAYKEMGLFEEAVKAFTKVLQAKSRQAQCYVMIGLCQRERGNLQESIHEFKQGLHASPTERERLSLFYELGISYDALGDGGEATYYFEAVFKRDPAFADTAGRLEALRQKGDTAAIHDDDL